MAALGAVICQVVVHHYGRDEFLRRLSQAVRTRELTGAATTIIPHLLPRTSDQTDTRGWTTRAALRFATAELPSNPTPIST